MAPEELVPFQDDKSGAGLQKEIRIVSLLDLFDSLTCLAHKFLLVYPGYLSGFVSNKNNIAYSMKTANIRLERKERDRKFRHHSIRLDRGMGDAFSCVASIIVLTG